MKKIISAVFVLCIVFSLAACASSAGKASADKQTSAEAVTKPAPAEEAPVENVQTEDSIFAIAEKYIDCPVSDLIAVLGEPDSTEYVPSCAAENAEDGFLMYGDVCVFTLKLSDGQEKVTAVDYE